VIRKNYNKGIGTGERGTALSTAGLSTAGLSAAGLSVAKPVYRRPVYRHYLIFPPAPLFEIIFYVRIA